MELGFGFIVAGVVAACLVGLFAFFTKEGSDEEIEKMNERAVQEVERKEKSTWGESILLVFFFIVGLISTVSFFLDGSIQSTL